MPFTFIGSKKLIEIEENINRLVSVAEKHDETLQRLGEILQNLDGKIDSLSSKSDCLEDSISKNAATLDAKFAESLSAMNAMEKLREKEMSAVKEEIRNSKAEIRISIEEIHNSMEENRNLIEENRKNASETRDFIVKNIADTGEKHAVALGEEIKDAEISMKNAAQSIAEVVSRQIVGEVAASLERLSNIVTDDCKKLGDIAVSNFNELLGRNAISASDIEGLLKKNNQSLLARSSENNERILEKIDAASEENKSAIAMIDEGLRMLLMNSIMDKLPKEGGNR